MHDGEAKPISDTLRKVWAAVCINCGAHQRITADGQTCHCGQNLSIIVRPDPTSIHALKVPQDDLSLWRFDAFLPVSSEYASHLQVGGTPLLDLGMSAGCRLMLKDETRNPSGSIKDRASEVVLAVARSQGIKRVVMASTGNAAASLSAIGAATRTEVTVLVPKSVPIAKLAQIRAFGATVHKIDGTYAQACEIAGKLAKATGALNRTTGLNPFTREGKKTCAFEIASQLDWQVPDWVIVPTGDGNILSAMAKGFDELQTAGLTQALPRLVAAQTAAAAPIAAAFSNTEVEPSDYTVADSIWVADPLDGPAALAALRHTQGQAVILSDTEIASALLNLSSRFGVLVEPSSATGFAAFLKLAKDGVFEPDSRVVLLGTGSGLKDLRVVIAHAEAQPEVATTADNWETLIPQSSTLATSTQAGSTQAGSTQAGLTPSELA